MGEGEHSDMCVARNRDREGRDAECSLSLAVQNFTTWSLVIFFHSCLENVLAKMYSGSGSWCCWQRLRTCMNQDWPAGRVEAGGTAKI